MLLCKINFYQVLYKNNEQGFSESLSNNILTKLSSFY